MLWHTNLATILMIVTTITLAIILNGFLAFIFLQKENKPIAWALLT